jgi:hypothetical protein
MKETTNNRLTPSPINDTERNRLLPRIADLNNLLLPIPSCSAPEFLESTSPARPPSPMTRETILAVLREALEIMNDDSDDDDDDDIDFDSGLADKQ